MSDRELREELEALHRALKRAEQELEGWDSEARIASERAALEAELQQLTQREAAAEMEHDEAQANLRQLNGELSLANDSLAEARRSIAQLESPARARRGAPGCLVVFTVLTPLALAGALR